MNYKIIQHVTKLSIGFMVIAAGTLSMISCSDSSNEASLWQRIESTIDKTMSENGIPGAIVGVWPERSAKIIALIQKNNESGFFGWKIEHGRTEVFERFNPYSS